MASTTASKFGGQPTAAGARWALLVVGVSSAAAGAMFVIGALVQAVVAGEHGQYHALFAGVFLAPAIVLALRSPRGGPASTPVVIGLSVAAITQLVEGVGGFGYGPGNADRINALASVHDLGVTIAPIGLVAAALGLTLGIGQLLRPRFGRWPAVALAVIVLAGLGFVITKMIGM
jgi:hypothetical protein